MEEEFAQTSLWLLLFVRWQLDFHTLENNKQNSTFHFIIWKELNFYSLYENEMYSNNTQ